MPHYINLASSLLPEFGLNMNCRAYKLVQEALGDAKVELKLKSNIRSKETKSAMSELKGFLTWLEGINDRAHRTANQVDVFSATKSDNLPDLKLFTLRINVHCSVME